jgi:hypothetical protein
MGLFTKELAIGTPANECFGICQSSQPVETRTKYLNDVREAAWFPHTPS